MQLLLSGMKRSTWRRASFRRAAACTGSQLWKSWSCQFGQFFAGKVLKSGCTIRKLGDSQPRGWRQWRLFAKGSQRCHTYSKGCFSLFFTLMLVQLKWSADTAWTSKKWVYILRLHNFTTFHNGSLAVSSSPQVVGESVNFIGLSALKWKAE